MFIFPQAHPHLAQGLQDLDAEWAHRGFGTLPRGSPGGVEGILGVAQGDAEMGVHDPAVGIQPEAAFKQVGTVPIHAVEPVAIIEIAVALRGLRDRFRGLMNAVVVKVGNHGVQAAPGQGGR